MKRKTLLTFIAVCVCTGSLFAAQPYNTKKSPKLLKVQSPALVVKDIDISNAPVLEKVVPITSEILKASDNSNSELAEVSLKRNVPQSVSVASSNYVPTTKQLRKAKRLEKKLEKQRATDGGSKSAVAAILLCFFVGIFGIHRFYMGYYGIGILQLITLGFFGIWTLIDFILLIVGELQPKNGQFEKSIDDEIDDLF